MSISNWSSIAYLYIWPESERFKKAINDDSEGSVYTTPVLKSDEPLKDEVAEAIQQLQVQPYKQIEHGFDKTALKALIVSDFLFASDFFNYRKRSA
jgi:hypothetical protein